jgi:hypothetical protein
MAMIAKGLKTYVSLGNLAIPQQKFITLWGSCIFP